MNTIDLKKYSPIISDRTTGEKIYTEIMKNEPSKNRVTIDMSSIKSMATFCAKQIFGKLYIELGSESFFKNIIIKGASDDVQSIIKLGIRFAVENRT
jgi:hypothetical protein